MKLLNDEQHEFLMKNYKGIGNIELTELINNTFNTNFRVQQIKQYKNNRHLDSGITGRFEKGQKSWNKGKKWEEFMSEQGRVNSSKTWYRKGNIADNADPIGTEKWKSSHKDRNNDEGFLYVKVQDGKKQANWKQKHRIIWEEAYGKIPRGYKVIFKDGNRHNITLDNLALVSNSQMLILNKNNLIYSEKELTEVGINIAKIRDKANKLINDRKEKKKKAKKYSKS